MTQTNVLACLIEINDTVHLFVDTQFSAPSKSQVREFIENHTILTHKFEYKKVLFFVANHCLIFQFYYSSLICAPPKSQV